MQSTVLHRLLVVAAVFSSSFCLAAGPVVDQEALKYCRFPAKPPLRTPVCFCSNDAAKNERDHRAWNLRKIDQIESWRLVQGRWIEELVESENNRRLGTVVALDALGVAASLQADVRAACNSKGQHASLYSCMRLLQETQGALNAAYYVSDAIDAGHLTCVRARAGGEITSPLFVALKMVSSEVEKTKRTISSVQQGALDAAARDKREARAACAELHSKGTDAASRLSKALIFFEKAELQLTQLDRASTDAAAIQFALQAMGERCEPVHRQTSGVLRDLLAKLETSGLGEAGEARLQWARDRCQKIAQPYRPPEIRTCSFERVSPTLAFTIGLLANE